MLLHQPLTGRLLGKAGSFAGDLSTDESSSDSGIVDPTWIGLTLSSELLSFPDECDSWKGCTSFT